MTRTEFCNKLGGVFGRVDSKRFGDYQKRTGKFCNCELFSRTLDLGFNNTDLDNAVVTHQAGCKVLQVDAQGRLNCTSSRNNRSTLKSPFDYRQSVM